MKASELRSKTPRELEKEAFKLREKLAESKREAYKGVTKNTREVRSMRRSLARTLTVLGELQSSPSADKEKKE